MSCMTTGRNDMVTSAKPRSEVSLALNFTGHDLDLLVPWRR